MNMHSASQMLVTEKEGRAQPRFTVALPALGWLDGTRLLIQPSQHCRRWGDDRGRD